MFNKFIKTGLWLFLVFASLNAKAVTVTIEDMLYELNTQSNTASVLGNMYSDQTSISIPSSIEVDGVSYTVTTIGTTAFNGYKLLDTISLPSTITTIENNAFGFSGLTHIEIPEKVTEIADNTFGCCQKLESIKFPPHLKKIGANAFAGCKFKSLEIPEGVTTIGSCAFGSCAYLETLSLPSTLKTILTGMLGDPFGELYSLQTLIIKCSTPPSTPAGIIANGSIPNESCTLYVPAGCEDKYREKTYWQHLKYITSIGSASPITVATIDGLKYSLHHSDLTAIILPKGRQTNSLGADDIPNPNESYVSGSITIPTNVEYNGDTYNIIALAPYVFARCLTLNEVVLSDLLHVIPKGAFEGSALESIIFSNEITEIEASAFNYMTNLKSLRFPDSLKKIGDASFSECLDEIIFPASLEETAGFYLYNPDCKFYSLNPIPPTVNGYINNTYASTLYVPEEAVVAYKSANEWKKFKNIVPIINDLTISSTIGGEIAVNNILLSSQQSSFDGEDFNIRFFPDENFVVNSVLLNGSDVSGNIANRELNLSGLMMQNHLEVSFTERNTATLCIKGAETHSTIHTYAEGTEAAIELRPEAGWTINTVLYNDEDVTSELRDNVFTTAPLYGDNSLVIVLSQDITTEIEEIDAASLVSLSVTGNTVTISGLGETDLVTVNDLSGKVVYSGLEHEISLLAGNVYIIATPRKVFKLTL